MKARRVFSGNGNRIVVSVVLLMFFSLQLVKAQEWYNPAWPYRVPLTIENTLASVLTDYQVQLNLNASGPWSSAATDGSDLRFTASDGVTEIPYWIETWVYGSSASIWVKVPSVAASGNTTIYMYYGANNVLRPSVFVETAPTGPFTKASGNPIIPSGDPDNDGESFLAENIVYDPVSQRYWMVFSNYRNGQDIGLMWSLDPSDPDAWTLHDDVVIEDGNAPHLMEYNGTWYIFYSDRPASTPFNIVVQSTTDLMNVPFSNKQTVLTPTETWENNRVDEPYIIRRNDGKWVLLYMGENSSGKFQVGYATSDLLTSGYQKYDNGDDANEGLFIPLGSSGSFDYGMVCHPWAYEFEGTYYIGYTASSTSSTPYSTALATTTDWNSIVKHGIIIPAGSDGTTFRGAVIRVGDEYIFSYTRGSASPFTSGIATQPVMMELTAEEVGAGEVFDFYDDFNGTAVDFNKWGISFNNFPGTITMDGSGILVITQPASASSTKLTARSAFGTGTVVEINATHNTIGLGRSMSVGFNIPGAFSLDGMLRIYGYQNDSGFWRKQAATSGTSSSVSNMLQAFDANPHEFRIFRNPSSSAGFQVDNNTIETVSSNIPTSNLNPFFFCYGSSNQITIDWVRVRKWAGAEMDVTIGSPVFNGSQWNGTISVDWHLEGNWTGNVPDISSNVLIPSGTPYQPLISASASCNNITILTGASLSVSLTHQLEVAGNWINDGSFNAANSTVILNGSDQSIAGSSVTTFHNLLINSAGTVELGINALISGDLDLTSGVIDLGGFSCNHVLNDPLTGTFYIRGNSSLLIGGTGSLPDNFNSYSISPSSKVEYGGGDQTIRAVMYGNLVLSGSGIKTVTDNFSVSGNTTFKGSVVALLNNVTPSTTGTLILGSQAAASGTWGSTASAAGHRNNDWFSVSGTGILTVSSEIISGTWLGAISSNWNAMANWAGGVVPGSSTDVIIPDYAINDVLITGLSSPALCNNLTVSSGKSLNVDPGQALTVNGNLTNNGSITVESSWLNNNGSLIVFGTSSGSGTVSYQRVIRQGDNTGDKHLLAAPVGGFLIEDFIGTFEEKIDSVRVWNEYNGIWSRVTAGPFESGKGYNIYQTDESDGEFVFTGLLTNSATFTATSPYALPFEDRDEADPYGNDDPSVDDLWTTGRGYISGVWTNWGGGGWNLLGNPFASALDGAAFIAHNLGDGITVPNSFDPSYQALYVYDGVNGYYRYVAATVPGYGTDPYVQGGTFGSRIQAGQGFMVMANNNEAVFEFTPEMQVHQTALPLLKSSPADEPWPGLELKVKWGEKENITTIVFNDGMTCGLDPGFDVGLMSTGPAVEIYTTLVQDDNAVNMTRQALPVAGADTLSIPVGIDCYAGAEVTFSAYTVPIGNRKFWLEDRTSGTFTDITTKSYTVTLPGDTYGTGRFFIIASTNTPTGIRNPVSDVTKLRVWAAYDKIIIRGEVTGTAVCELFDLNGKRVLARQLGDGSLNTIDIPSGLHGIYMVRVIDGPEVTTVKIPIL